MSSENTAAHKPAPSAPTSAIDRYFKITERGSTLSTEVRGGLATFFAMAYIVVLNPSSWASAPTAQATPSASSASLQQPRSWRAS